MILELDPKPQNLKIPLRSPKDPFKEAYRSLYLLVGYHGEPKVNLFQNIRIL